MVGSVEQGVPEPDVAQRRTLGIPDDIPAPARSVEGIDNRCCWSIWRRVLG